MEEYSEMKCLVAAPKDKKDKVLRVQDDKRTEGLKVRNGGSIILAHATYLLSFSPVQCWLE